MKDLNIIQTIDSQARLKFSKQGNAIEAAQKVAQEFVTFFLAQKGTVRFIPIFGTDFVFDASVGTIRTETDAVHHFAQAEVDLRNYVITKTLTTETEDDIFRSAALMEVSYPGNGLQLTVRIRTEAGSGVTADIPIMSLRIL